ATNQRDVGFVIRRERSVCVGVTAALLKKPGRQGRTGRGKRGGFEKTPARSLERMKGHRLQRLPVERFIFPVCFPPFPRRENRLRDCRASENRACSCDHRPWRCACRRRNERGRSGPCRVWPPSPESPPR